MFNLLYRLIDSLAPLLFLWLVQASLQIGTWSEPYTLTGVLAGGLLLLFTQLLGGYSRFEIRTMSRKLEVVFKSWIYLIVVLAVLGAFFDVSHIVSMSVLFVWTIITPLFILITKLWLVRECSRRTKEKRVWLMLGEFYQFTDFEKVHLDNLNVEIVHCPYEHFEGLQKCVKDFNAVGMVMNVKSEASSEFVQALTHLELSGVKLFSMNRFFERFLRKCYVPYDVVGVDYLDDVARLSGTQNFIKRCIDIFVSGLLLLISLPALVVSIFVTKNQSPGSILFRQTRVGINAKNFEVLKFRSMHENSHFDPYTQEEDTRIFPYGNFMRKSRIDELPQLWNVLRGDMHLIGPRTEWNILVANYEKEIPFYHERHLVRPGITGWAQVMYPYGANTEDARQKLMYDLYYIKHWSIWLEIETLLRTVLVVLGKKGL